MKKRLLSTISVLAGSAIVLFSCTSKEREEEITARKYCASCHAFPPANQLDKHTWAKVLPQMAFRMGLDVSELMNIPEEDRENVMLTLPSEPLLSNEEYEAIKAYYLREAPDSLAQRPLFDASPTSQFTFEPHLLFSPRPTITMVRADTAHQRIWFSNREMKLYATDFHFNINDSMQLRSPASYMQFDGDSALISLLGIMDPNDQAKGEVARLRNGRLTTLADSIKRPAYVERADFNNDHREDIVVCAFGNYGGELVVYENTARGYIPHVIGRLPGARKVFIRDFDNDGLQDILALFTQGDEQISLYTNAGSFRFRITTLLRFSPADGSSYFDLADFNKDGHWDILYTNGDNADFSTILKPYHGIHVFTNNGRNEFSETFFQQFHGASMAVPADFDLDGDIDIAATSFFPDFAQTPERTFVYLQNNSGTFTPFVNPITGAGRWLIIEPVDIDTDGDKDLILGALNFDTGVPPGVVADWKANPVDVMLLRNNQKK